MFLQGELTSHFQQILFEVSGKEFHELIIVHFFVLIVIKYKKQKRDEKEEKISLLSGFLLLLLLLLLFHLLLLFLHFDDNQVELSDEQFEGVFDRFYYKYSEQFLSKIVKKKSLKLLKKANRDRKEKKTFKS